MKKTLSLLLAIVLFSCLGLPVFQNTAWAENNYLPITNLPYGETYASGPYFSALVQAMSESTGLSPADRFVKIAKTQVGYKGCSKKVGDGGTLSGEHNFSAGKYTEYSNQIGGYGSDWCAAFVSWCAYASGIPTNVIKRVTSAKHTNQSSSYGSLIPIFAEDYSSFKNPEPQKGDLIFLNPYCTECSTSSALKHFDSLGNDSHVGIVSDVRKSSGVWQIKFVNRDGNVVKESAWCSLNLKRGVSNTCKCETSKVNSASYKNYSDPVNGSHCFTWLYRPDWSRVSTWSSSDVAKLSGLIEPESPNTNSASFKWKYSNTSEVNSEKGFVRFYCRCELSDYDANKINEIGLVVDNMTVWCEKNNSNIQGYILSNQLGDFYIDFTGLNFQFNFTPGFHEYYFYITYDGRKIQSAYGEETNYSNFILPLPSSERAGVGYYVPYNSYELRRGYAEANSEPTGLSTVVGYNHQVQGGYYNPGRVLWYYMLSETNVSGWAYEPNFGTYQGFTSTVKRVNNENNECPLYSCPPDTASKGTATIQMTVPSGTRLSVVGEAYNRDGYLWYNVKADDSDSTYWVWNDYLLEPDSSCMLKTVNGKTVYVQNDPVAGIFVSPDLEGANVMELPESLSAIGEEAFTGTGAQTVIIPAGIISVADNAFSGCSSLEYIVNNSKVSIIPPEGVIVITND